MPRTAKLKLTDFQAYIASGSDISNPTADSGYQPALAAELARIVPYAGTIEVDATGAADLAEFADSLANSVAQEPNPSGARSLTTLADRARKLARELS